ncbi:MAG: hypothetical protein NTW62_01025 [Candidatus Nomurabacteria bacterium]|nr:hypothetical protein [Candidatus Nomurabacteria bacterium]
MKKYLGLLMVLGLAISYVGIAHAEDNENEGGGLNLGLGQMRQDNKVNRDAFKAQAETLKQQRQGMNQGIQEAEGGMDSQIENEREGLKSGNQADIVNMKAQNKAAMEALKANPAMTQAEKDALKAKIESDRTALKTEIKTRMDAFKTEVEAKKATFKATTLAQRSDFRKNAEEMKTQRFANAVSNLEAIQAKVSAKITELSATGINTTDAQTFLDSSVKNLADAKAKIAEIVVPADGSTITADQFAAIKLTARDARNLLEQSRQDLKSSIKSLRIATGSTEGSTPENNASTTQQ